MRDIVVLAGSSPWSVLSLCKCAYKYKVKTFVVCINNGWGRKYAKSRYVNRAYDTNEGDIDAFWQFFFDENIFIETPILYVTNDHVCQIVERNRKFFETRFVLCMASSYIITSFIDKNLASMEAQKHGLVVPKTQEIRDNNDIEKVCKTFKFPVIVKPVTFRDHCLAGFKTQICDTEEQLCAFIPPHLKNGINLQCQEYIIGNDKDCSFYQFYRDKLGNIVECMGEKTLQTNGIMTIGTTKYDAQMALICRSFLQSINYIGIGGIEFKLHNGIYYFIEMSTRTEGFLPISDMSHVSLSGASFCSLNGLPVKQSQQHDGVQYVVFMAMIKNMLRKDGIVPLCRKILNVILKRDHFFVGAFVELMFALRLDLRILK